MIEIKLYPNHYFHRSNKTDIPIDIYANKLVEYMEIYLKKVEYSMNNFSKKTCEKTKIQLKWFIFENDNKIKDFQYHKEVFDNETYGMFSKYTKCIMQLVGQLAECVIIDHCNNDDNINKVCINIAKFMPNIYREYPEIDYEQYIAFSPSFKSIIYKESTSKIAVYKNYDYNPMHTSKDIGWCKKDNILSQLKVNLNEIDYLDNAKLQIKSTLDCDNLKIDNYILTPVICFDFNDDFYKLKNKYPDYAIYSVRRLFPNLYYEMERYFKILAAYAIGLIDHINITDNEISQNSALSQFFRTPVMDLKKDETCHVVGVIELAKQLNKPNKYIYESLK